MFAVAGNTTRSGRKSKKYREDAESDDSFESNVEGEADSDYMPSESGIFNSKCHNKYIFCSAIFIR